MATPADQRLTELLDRWLASLDLHIKYSSLDEDTYWKVQPWVEHQRPARWILDLARQKTAALKAQVGERIAAGDARFSDALEEMMFLANLVGLQHIERFIPVAEPQDERGDASADGGSGTREMPRMSTATTGTREMLRPPAPRARSAAAASTPLVARAERKAPARPAARTPLKGAAKPRREPAAEAGAGAGAAGAAGAAVVNQVMADALRLLKWGRQWYELADLIARIADRPSAHDVRRILDENRARIEKTVQESRG